MKSVAQQLSEVCDSLKASGHTQLVTETLRQDSGKNLEGKLAKLTEFAESRGIATREEEKTAHTALVEAAQKAYGMTKEEAEVFANPHRANSSTWGGVNVDDLLKETK